MRGLRTALSRMAAACGQPIDPSQQTRLEGFVDLVEQWRSGLNLVAASSEEELVERLVLDALFLADTAILPAGSHVIDVGAGVGAPTVPVLLLREDLLGTLIEPRHKRAAFLRYACASLGLTRVTVQSRRVEPGESWPRNPADVALSRAVFPPDEWLLTGSAIAPRVLLLTAQRPAPEATAGWYVDSRVSYSVPSSSAPRVITAYVQRDLGPG